MLTVVETNLFQRQWPLYWTEEERGGFAAYIAEHPTAGDVVPESGGIRKVRWSRAGSGKSGGLRVIYFTRTPEGEVVLLTLYAKAKTDNLTGAKLKEIRRALENQTSH
ncbi:MAG: Toxin HigB-2 [Dehalococcoidia bacterium]|nr:Toxin HigB-2 [Chloroflexota bacterium]